MTVETRSTIGLDDIIAIEYECPTCHTRTIRALNEQHRIPAMCGNCSSSWLIDGSREHHELNAFINVLRNFPTSSINQHVKIKLEIRGIEKAEVKPSASGHASDEKD